jgi:hypothetical protein
MNMLDFKSSDEKTHQASPHKHWNESFYVNFFDPAGNWGGASRIGFSPNQGFADGFICLYFPNGATGFIRTWESSSDHLNRNSAGPIEHVCVKPFEKWQLRYAGPIYYFEDPPSMGDFAQTMLTDLPKRELELNLQFEAVHEVFDFHASMKRELISIGDLFNKLRPNYFIDHLGPAIRKVKLLKIMSGAQHYEHAGRIEGTISVDGEIYTFNGFGQRDHSWGVRDMRVPANWRWFSGQFKDELCFNAIKVELLALRASGGYVYHQGKAEALKGWSFKADLDNSGLCAKSVSISLSTISGKQFDIIGEILENIPVRVNTGGYVSVVNESRTRFSWNGNTGYGISEFMEQIPL